MADDETKSDKPSSQRRRPATTIDVSAVEVSAPEAATASHAEAESSDTATATSAPPPASSSQPGKILPLLYGALAGGIVVLITGAGLWLLGLLPTSKVDTSELSTRLAKVESLAARSPAPPAQAKIPDDVAARLAKVEAAVSNPARAGNDAGNAARIGAVEAAVKALTNSTANFNSRNDEHAAALRELRSNVEAVHKAVADLRQSTERQRDGVTDKAELNRATARIDALETTARNIQQSANSKDEAAERAVKRALLASALRERVLTHAPFANELSAIKALGGDTAALSPLEPFAARGLPSAETLGKELVTLLPKITPPRDTPRSDSFLDRLQAHASHLIRIRPVGDAAGDDAATILGRVEHKAKQGDIDGVLADLLRLPPETRAPANEWIARAQARQAAVAAVRDFESKALAAVAQSVPQR